MLRQCLPQLSSTKHGINVEEVIDFILQDNEVQLSWITLAADLRIHLNFLDPLYVYGLPLEDLVCEHTCGTVQEDSALFSKEEIP